MSAPDHDNGAGMADSYGDWPLGVECAWPAALGSFDVGAANGHCATTAIHATSPAQPSGDTPRAVKSQSWRYGARDNVVALPRRLFPLVTKGACS